MVSAGVCFGGKRRLHFVDESANVDSAYYIGRLLPSLVNDCTRLLPCSGSGYIFQQDGAPAHTAHATQNWLQTNCPDFIAKDQWPPNSPSEGNVGGLSQAPSETENDRRTEGSPAVIWDSLPQRPIDKAVKEFSKRLKACFAADGGHFEHSL